MAEMSPLVFTSVGLLSARTVSYLVGFVLASILGTWLPIIAALVVIAGIFNPASKEECDNYYAVVAAISIRNRAAWQAAWDACWSGGIGGVGGYICPWGELLKVPFEPTPCTPPNCNGKKVWLQAIWASPSEFVSQSKGCFLIAYSYDKVDGLKVEYNPFKIPEPFLKSRALPWQVVRGDKFKQLRDDEWKNLESNNNWDKGYWVAENTDSECRGWRPGWSRKTR